MNQQQLLAQIAGLRKVYRALGEISDPSADDIRFAKLHIERAIQRLEWVIQDNYDKQLLREENQTISKTKWNRLRN